MQYRAGCNEVRVITQTICLSYTSIFGKQNRIFLGFQSAQFIEIIGNKNGGLAFLGLSYPVLAIVRYAQKR